MYTYTFILSRIYIDSSKNTCLIRVERVHFSVQDLASFSVVRAALKPALPFLTSYLKQWAMLRDSTFMAGKRTSRDRSITLSMLCFTTGAFLK